MSDKKGKILYLLHWFPAISETFILREILEFQKHGEVVDVARLNQSPDKITHSEVEKFDGEIFDPKKGFIHVLSAHFFWLTSSPEIYFPVLFTIVSKISHPKTVTVSLRAFCKAVRIAWQLKDSDYRHIHAHFGNAPATGAWILAKFLNAPFSFTLHAVGVFLPDKLLVRKVADSKFVGVISQFNINYLKERFPDIDSEKFKIVRCGICPDEFEFSLADKLNQPAKVLSVGRMVETKGFRDLIHAVKKLKNDGKPVELTLIGGGEKLDEFRKLASDLEIADLVKFTGPLPQNDVRDAMLNCDLFVLAASVSPKGDRDGIPVVLMESLAFGIPTISTEVSGIPELIKNFETGLLVPEKNPDALSDAMMLLINELGLRKRLSHTGRKLVEEQFNVEKNASTLLSLIGEVS
ncbi:MAG: glycosyltransferase [bacterium]